MSRTVYLDSGKWRAYPDPSASTPTLELVDVSTPWNKMRVPMAAALAEIADEALAALARRPEVRLWVDEDSIQWRVSAIGPGTMFPLPLHERHLLYDSEQAWSGIVPFDGERELGDLTTEDLRTFRNRISDIGGRRRRYRRPGREAGRLADRVSARGEEAQADSQIQIAAVEPLPDAAIQVEAIAPEPPLRVEAVSPAEPERPGE